MLQDSVTEAAHIALFGTRPDRYHCGYGVMPITPKCRQSVFSPGMVAVRLTRHIWHFYERTPRIQEAHILIRHILCELIEEDLSNVGYIS
jgi:hypothetical protein